MFKPPGRNSRRLFIGLSGGTRPAPQASRLPAAIRVIEAPPTTTAARTSYDASAQRDRRRQQQHHRNCSTHRHTPQYQSCAKRRRQLPSCCNDRQPTAAHRFSTGFPHALMPSLAQSACMWNAPHDSRNPDHPQRHPDLWRAPGPRGARPALHPPGPRRLVGARAAETHTACAVRRWQPDLHQQAASVSSRCCNNSPCTERRPRAGTRVTPPLSCLVRQSTRRV